MIDSYRNSKIAKQKELAKLTSDKAKEFVKLSDLNKKINSASDIPVDTIDYIYLEHKIVHFKLIDGGTARSGFLFQD